MIYNFLKNSLYTVANNKKGSIMLPPIRTVEPTYINFNDIPEDELCEISYSLLRDIAQQGTLTLTPCCIHMFSKDDLMEWLNIHATCPHCRSDLKKETLIPVIAKTNKVAADVFDKKEAHEPVILPVDLSPAAASTAPLIKPGFSKDEVKAREPKAKAPIPDKEKKIHKKFEFKPPKIDKKLLKLEKEMKKKAKEHDKKHHHHHH